MSDKIQAPARELITTPDGYVSRPWLYFFLKLASGIYTPTLTNVANLSALTAYQCQWFRVMNVITVSGRVVVDPILTATATKLGITLPISSVFAGVSDLAGVAFASAVAGQGAAIYADISNMRAQMDWVSGDVASRDMLFTFSYIVQ